MLSLITIFGETISTYDFWAGMLLLSAPVVIIVCSFIARTGRVDIVMGVLFLIVIGACLSPLIWG